MAYFQSNAAAGAWQQKINDVLRFYVETSQIAEADADAVAQQLELADEPAPSF